MHSLHNILYAGLAMTLTSVAAESSFSGHVFPPPQAVSQDADFTSSMKNMTSTLQNLINNSGAAKDNSFALMGSSTSESSPAFEFYHTGTQVDGATPEVGPDSVFRIGSISKLFTIYTLLVQSGYDVFSEPVLKYVPELRRGNGSEGAGADWEDVTVGALASHMAGVAKNHNMGDIAAQGLPVSQLGLPDLPQDEVPSCNGNFGQPLCSRQEFLNGIHDRDRVFPVWDSPAYSNAAFRILGYVGSKLEKNKNFSGVLEDDVLKPLGLKDTSSEKPDDSKGVIPSDGSLWSFDMGDEFTSGGMYSSVRDLCAFGQAILTNEQLTATTTRHWMKPVTFTQSLTSAVGMPWEIFRQDIGGHIVDFYTKGGSIGQYQSLLVLIPEYKFVFAGLAAGSDPGLALSARETVRKHLIPALNTLSRKQAASQYSGRYVSDEGNSSISITADNKPGLSIDGWISNDIDFAQSISAYVEMAGGSKLESMRLYPTDTRSDGRAVFRLIFVTGDDSEADEDVVFGAEVKAWMVVDVLTYGQLPMDELVFTLGEDGEAIVIESVGLRSTMRKVVEKSI